MTKHIVIACSIAALTTGAVAAQQSAPPSNSADALTITATGCLKSWDGKSATASPAAGAQYVLTNVEHGKSSSTPASADRAASDRGRAGGLVYVLSAGSSSVNLSAHLNHKVQIAGTKMPGHKGATGGGTTDMAATADRPGASSAPPTAPAQDRPDQSAQDKMHAAGAMPAISVTSITMIADTCS